MSLGELISGFVKGQEALSWTGSFTDYLEIVEKNPRVARLSHARVYDMIMSYGVEYDDEGNIEKYNFFAGEIFGCHQPIKAIVEYFRAAAQGLEPRKRILLLMGPAGGGKSSLVALLKKRLEAYTRTDEGVLYGIAGCPMHEEPLHLLPEDLRKEIKEKYGIYIEGDLCPFCRWRLENEWKGDFTKFQVKRVIFSEQGRKGIGTFSPSDPHTQDVAELIGSIDLAQIGEFGSESDPRAWRFDGELNIANRGICEFIELLKVDAKFLYLLLNLAQEQRIKAPRYPLIYADEIVISHSNEAEYLKFIAEKTNEALQDRIHLIKFPYNLAVSDEEQIYDKLLSQGSKRIHIAPNTTKAAAIFGVLTRLKDVETEKKISLIDKMKVYDGKKLKGWTDHEVRLLKQKNPDEGMTGAGPRFMIDALSKGSVKSDLDCINPIQALRSIIEHLDNHPRVDEKIKEEYKNHIERVREVYHDMLKKQIMSAFVVGYKEQAKAMVEDYLLEVNAWRKKDKIKDPITGEERLPNEKFMRDIEEQIGISEKASKEFREEIIAKVADLALEGKKFDYQSHDNLKEAIEKKLFTDVKSIVKTIISAKILDKEQEKRLDQVVEALKNEGYCEICAREVLKYMSRIID